MRERIPSKLTAWLLVMGFLVAIFVPLGLWMATEDKAKSSVEKRTLNQQPRYPYSAEELAAYPGKFNTYYADQFGLRDWFTQSYNTGKFQLGDSPSPNVTIGQDGWLFLGSLRSGYEDYDDPFGDVLGLNRYSDDQLQDFAKHLQTVQAWLAERGATYLFVIAPNKHSIYPEKLPGHIDMATLPPSVTDQLVEYLRANTSVPIVDLRAPLRDAKQQVEDDLYYHTDTHWNHFGANIAQYHIMKAVEELFPGKVEPTLANVQHTKPRDGGDLAQMMGVRDHVSETNPTPRFAEGCKPTQTPKEVKLREPHSFTCEGRELTALIFHDSFFTKLQPYIARQFKHSTYVWLMLNAKDLKHYVALKKPDIVIEEWVERRLPHVPELEESLD